MKYYDLHVHTNVSVGENSLEEIVEQAKRLNIDGLGITDYFSTVDEFMRRKKVKRPDIDIVFGVIIRAETESQLKKTVNAVRNKAELILVHGGNYEINRLASEMPEVDILAHPELERRDSGIDHIVARNMGENNVALEINFREILESFKKHRAYVLSNMRRNIYLAKKYNVPIVTTSSAYSIWGMRACRDLASFANLLGLDLPEAIATVSSTPEQIITSNRRKLANRVDTRIGDEL
ncbi:MAG: ribonuclease P [Candidatus Aenigmatarchaeota archaeon]|nr:MAG: ribonuclease P [Candidatus Aenigmarchaeota archaeon]